MSNTIYILTEGDYSDYHIIGAYSSEELANKAKVLYPYSRVEEYDLDSIPEHPPGMVKWIVRLENGQLSMCYRDNPDDFYNDFYGEQHTICRMWATDEEHAKKIALDRYYQHKAQEAGIA